MIRFGFYMFSLIALCALPFLTVETMAEPMQNTAFLDFEWPPDVATETNAMHNVHTEDFERLTSSSVNMVEPQAGEYVPPLEEVGWRS